MTNLLDQEDEVFDETKNYYEELVGEGKKFKDNEALAKGKAEADTFIKHLLREKEILTNDYLKLRETYNAGPKLEELIDRLEDQRLASSENTTTANEETNMPKYNPAEVESLVSSKIQEYELTKRQENNFTEVKKKLKERFGNNYQSALQSQIENLGLTEDFVNTMARNHPQGFYKLFGLSDQKGENFQTPPQSAQRPGFAPHVEKRDWAYYENMRKSDPVKYNNPKTQLQIIDDAVALGTAFGMPED